MSERPEHPTPKTKFSPIEVIVLVIALAICIGALASILISRWPL